MTMGVTNGHAHAWVEATPGMQGLLNVVDAAFKPDAELAASTPAYANQRNFTAPCPSANNKC